MSRHLSCRIGSVASLMKLHRKSKSMDTYLDDRMDINTTRVAWNEVTDNLERGVPCPRVIRHPALTLRILIPAEAHTHLAFLDCLVLNIISPLFNFRVRAALSSARGLTTKQLWGRPTGGARAHPEAHSRGY